MPSGYYVVNKFQAYLYFLWLHVGCLLSLLLVSGLAPSKESNCRSSSLKLFKDSDAEVIGRDLNHLRTIIVSYDGNYSTIFCGAAAVVVTFKPELSCIKSPNNRFGVFLHENTARKRFRVTPTIYDDCILTGHRH